MANEIQKHLMAVPSTQTSDFITHHVGGSITSTDPYYSKVCFLEGTGEIVTRGKKYAINSKNIDTVLKILLGTDEDDNTKIANPGKSLVEMFSDTITELTFNSKNIATSDNNITINYKEENGIVTINSITPLYASFTRTEMVETNGVLSAPNLTMVNGDGGKLVRGNDIMSLKGYTDDSIAKVKADILTGNAGGEIEQAYDTIKEIATWIADNDSAADASGIVHDISVLQNKQTEATYTGGVNPLLTYTNYSLGHDDYLLKASSVDAIKKYINAKVTIAQNDANAGIEALDVATYTVTGTNISFSYNEVDGIIKIDNLKEQYATVQHGTNNGAEYPSLSLADGHENKLIKASDLILMRGYVDAAIQSLDSEITSNTGTFLNVKVTETDGKITAVTVIETLANVQYTAPDTNVEINLAATNSNGAVKGSDIIAIKDYIDAKTDDLSAALNGLDHTAGTVAAQTIDTTTYQYSYVSVTQQDAAITSMVAYHTIGAVSGSTGNVTTNGLIDANSLATTLSQLDLWCIYEGEPSNGN